MSVPIHHHQPQASQHSHHHHHRDATTHQQDHHHPQHFLSFDEASNFELDNTSANALPSDSSSYHLAKPEVGAEETAPPHHYHHPYMQPAAAQDPSHHQHMHPIGHGHPAYSHPLQHLLQPHYGSVLGSLLHSPYHQDELTPHEDIPLFGSIESNEEEEEEEQRSGCHGGGEASGGMKGEEEGGMVRLWGCDWRRQTSKDGKSVLVTVLPTETDYEKFMKQFDVNDHDKGFYWVTDRGRKYSKATTTTMQRMRWKDTFNCFFGRRHSKKGASEGASKDDGEEGGAREGGKKKRSRASQKLYCPASLSATCVMDGTVELRYFDSHVDHSMMGPPPRRKRQEERGQRRMKLLQNEHLSAWRTVIKPNQPPKLHRHDKDRLVYVLKGGRLKVVGENNKLRKIYNLEADKAYWFPRDPPGELHGDVNEGSEPIMVLVVEVEDRQADLNLPPPVMSFA